MKNKTEKERRKIDGFDLKQNIMAFPEPENSLWFLKQDERVSLCACVCVCVCVCVSVT